MEALIIIVGIVLTLTLTLTLARFNRQMIARMPDNAAAEGVTGSSKTRWMNRAGFWLALLGAVTTAPLVVAMTFFTDDTGWGWAVWPGIAGCLAIMLAAGLVVPIFIGQCVRHRIRLQRLGKHFYRQSVKPAVQRYGLKASLLLAGLLLLAPLVPYVLELVKIIAYVAGLVIAGRLGLLDNLNSNYNVYGSHYFSYDECDSYPGDEEDKARYQEEVDLGFH